MKKSHQIIILIVLVIILLILFFSFGHQESVYDNENLGLQDKMTRLRRLMVENQIKARGIKDSRVLAAMETVERHRFVPSNIQNNAYQDNPLPIGYGQTISQPYIVALMTESLELDSDDKVLEIGTGSGYQAAILSEIVAQVYTIEIIPELAERSQKTLASLGYDQVKVKNADGYFGWEEEAPFDAIIVTAAANHIPPPLIAQLKEGGRLIIPLGDLRHFQTLTLGTKKSGNLVTKYITSVAFVPMTGVMLED